MTTDKKFTSQADTSDKQISIALDSEINAEWTLLAIRCGRTMFHVHAWNEVEPLLGKMHARD